MTAGALTLTDFLLARIAEDERPTYELPPYDCPPDCCAPAGWVGHTCLICDTTEFGGTVAAMTQVAQEHERDIHARARVLAECKARRAIVKEAWNYSPELEHGDNGEWAFDTALQHLAAIYADHPDYRSEWSL